MSATLTFHVSQALCLRTNVHSHAPQVRQRNMRTANAICGRDAKCSLQLTQFHLICDSDLTQTHRNRIAQVLCNGPRVRFPRGTFTFFTFCGIILAQKNPVRRRSSRTGTAYSTMGRSTETNEKHKWLIEGLILNFI